VIVVIQRAPAFFALGGHLNGGGVGEINVHPAVAIVIEQNHSTTGGFDDVFILRS